MATPGDEVPAEQQPAPLPLTNFNVIRRAHLPQSHSTFLDVLDFSGIPLRDSIPKLNSLPCRKYLNGCEQSGFAHL